MSSIPGAYRNLREQDIIDMEPGYVDEPDMSQVDQEMPTIDEYRRWEEAFTAHLGFTSPEFNFKLMRFIGASRNMIDELRDMLQDVGTRSRWDEFVKHQKDHKLILIALTAVASEPHRPDRPDTSNWQWRKAEPATSTTRKRKRCRRKKITTKKKKKVKRRQRWTAHKSS